MKFEDALKAMRDGKKVTRKSWSTVLGTPRYIYLLNEKFYYYSGIEDREIDIGFPCDIFSKDWEVVEE